MKFPIRYADQVVGAFIILALGILVFVIFLLGSNQRWFSRDYDFMTYFNSATGLSQNMSVQYKGFTIGHVKSIRLSEDDRVEVRFTIFDTYRDRVKTGSLVEIAVSPIGALGGSQFLFYPGLGADLIPENGIIPIVNSPEGQHLLSIKLAQLSDRDDSISIIMNRVNTLLGTVNEVLSGTDSTPLGRTTGELEKTVIGVRQLIDTLPSEIIVSLDKLMVQLDPILTDLRELSGKIANPDGSVAAILDAEGDVYNNLVSSLEAVSGALQNVESTTAFIPSQMPQVAAVLVDLHSALKAAEDVLVALTNNPLLKGGVPVRVETNVGGAHTRDMEF